VTSLAYRRNSHFWCYCSGIYCRKSIVHLLMPPMTLVALVNAVFSSHFVAFCICTNACDVIAIRTVTDELKSHYFCHALKITWDMLMTRCNRVWCKWFVYGLADATATAPPQSINQSIIKVICNARNVVHKLESEARAVASGRVLMVIEKVELDSSLASVKNGFLSHAGLPSLSWKKGR